MKNRTLRVVKFLVWFFPIVTTGYAQNDDVKISMLGHGAVKIHTDSVKIYVDCFSEASNKENIAQYSDADFIVITHNDWDHYESSYVAKVAEVSGAVIVGPPSIAYPLLAEYNIKKEKLYILYPTQPENPVDTFINQVNFKVYQSTHFNNWFPIHLSYLISFKGKKIYLNGDSYSNLLNTKIDDLIDVVVCNMVEGNDDVGKYFSKLKTFNESINSKYFLPCHLIDCEFTIQPAILKEAIKNSDMKNIIVIENVTDEFALTW